MHRFFVHKDNITADSIRITGEDSEHISRVLRLRVKDRIIVCDGEENEYICELQSVDKKSVLCSIIERYRSAAEPPLKVCLFQGIPKSAKMDMIVQKCTEIGIDEIVPVDTERVVIKLGEDGDLRGKLARWQKIAVEAAKQCGRGRIPSIRTPISFKDAMSMINMYELCIIPYEKEGARGLKQVLKGKDTIKSAAIIIGPEGGFSEEEVNEAVKCGAVSVTLGPRILRTETAGFVCLTMLMYESGDLGGELWKE